MSNAYQYGTVKRLENFWKGLSHDMHQISPIPPVPYGDRFIKFIMGITKTPEEAEREAAEAAQRGESVKYPHEARSVGRSNTDNSVIQQAEHQAHKTEKKGADESRVPDRILMTQRNSSVERSNDRAGMTLPIVDEVGENSSTGGKSGRSVNEMDEIPPPIPPKDEKDRLGGFERRPQVPPKEPSIRGSFDSNKALPSLPPEEVVSEKGKGRLV